MHAKVCLTVHGVWALIAQRSRSPVFLGGTCEPTNYRIRHVHYQVFVFMCVHKHKSFVFLLFLVLHCAFDWQ